MLSVATIQQIAVEQVETSLVRGSKDNMKLASGKHQNMSTLMSTVIMYPP